MGILDLVVEGEGPPGPEVITNAAAGPRNQLRLAGRTCGAHKAVRIREWTSCSRRQTVASGSNPTLGARSEEHTSELQSLMRNSYAVFCLKKKKYNTYKNN